MSSSSSYKPSVSLTTKKFSSSSVLSSSSDPNEARWWRDKFGLSSSSFSKRKFASPHSITITPLSNHIVSSLSFSNNTLTVGCGPRVCLYNINNTTTMKGDSISTPTRTIHTGGYVCTSLSIRHDGRLLAVGNTNNQVRICDVTTSSRATLVTLKPANNTSPSTNTATNINLSIRSICWLPNNGKQLVSVGDDAIVRLWSISNTTTNNEALLLSLSGHGDSIRSVVVVSTTTTLYKQMCVTGSYDHTIRIWNIDEQEDVSSSNNNRCLAVLNHGAPVEKLLLLPHSDDESMPWLLSAGGTTLKVWNIQSSACVCTLATRHSKTITSVICMNRGNDSSLLFERRILTAGLDGLIRIHTFNSSTGQVAHIHGIQLQDPISSLAVNETTTTTTMDRLAIGFTTGQVIVRQRGASIVPQKRSREPRAGTYAYFVRGMNASSSSTSSDFVLESLETKRKLTAFDMALKQFRYGDALDEALETRQPQAVVAVLEELGKRRGLTIALSNRDEESLEPILSFTVRYITRPQFSSLLIGVANMLCDIYGGVTGQSETIDELFGKLRNQVYNECVVQKSLLRIVGQLDALLTAAEMVEDSYDE